MPGQVVTRASMDPLLMDNYQRPTHGKGKKKGKKKKKRGVKSAVNKSSKVQKAMMGQKY